MAKKEGGSELVRNRRATYDYEILETFEAGVVLVGTEVKSLRAHEASLAEAYVRLIDHELWLVGASIMPYRFGNIRNHEEKRDRKLLLHRREIEQLRAWVKEKGQTLIPLALYLKAGRVKLRFGRARGKKTHDKRHAIREREEKRQMDRLRKQ